MITISARIPLRSDNARVILVAHSVFSTVYNSWFWADNLKWRNNKTALFAPLFIQFLQFLRNSIFRSVTTFSNRRTSTLQKYQLIKPIFTERKNGWTIYKNLVIIFRSSRSRGSPSRNILNFDLQKKIIFSENFWVEQTSSEGPCGFFCRGYQCVIKVFVPLPNILMQHKSQTQIVTLLAPECK